MKTCEGKDDGIRIERLTKLSPDMLKLVTKWMYEWWGEAEGHSLEAVACYMEHSLQEERLPQTFGIFLGEELIGLYQLRLDDLFVRPDIYPWLANVYIAENYRNRGYGKVLLGSIRENARKCQDYKELYLYTKHCGLYERYGWEFVAEIDTFLEPERMQRLYKLKL